MKRQSLGVVAGFAAPLLLALLLSAAIAAAEEVDAAAVVVRVIDGDTFDARIIKVYSNAPRCLDVGPGDTVRVRLADVDTPERWEPGYVEATAALESLVDHGLVYLDVDDLYCRGRYGRLIAVVYVPVNDTTLINVNAWLLVNGYARIADYPNEFSPLTWSLYVEVEGSSGSQGEETGTAAGAAARTVTVTVTSTVTRTKTVTVSVPVYTYSPVTVTVTERDVRTVTETRVVTARVTDVSTRLVTVSTVVERVRPVTVTETVEVGGGSVGGGVALVAALVAPALVAAALLALRR